MISHRPFSFSHKTILITLANLGDLDFLNRHLALLGKLTTQSRDFATGQVGVSIMNLACRHRLNCQNLQQVSLDGFILQLRLRGLAGALCVSCVQLFQFSGGVSSQLVIHISGNDGIEKFAISHSYSFHTADRSPPILFSKEASLS